MITPPNIKHQIGDDREVSTDMLTTTKAARHLGLAVSTLNKWRGMASDQLSSSSVVLSGTAAATSTPTRSQTPIYPPLPLYIKLKSARSGSK